MQLLDDSPLGTSKAEHVTYLAPFLCCWLLCDFFDMVAILYRDHAYADITDEYCRQFR